MTLTSPSSTRRVVILDKERAYQILLDATEDILLDLRSSCPTINGVSLNTNERHYYRSSEQEV